MFHPRLVKEIRKGYYYIPSESTGFGTTSFAIQEGNKNTPFNSVQATTSQEPSIVNNNGFQQLSYAFASNQKTKTSGNVVAGWTGATYMGLWWRIPLDGLSNSGITTIFAHNSANPGLRWRFFHTGGITNTMSLSVSTDGAATQTDIWPGPNDTLYHYLECLYTPSVGVDFYKDFVLIAHSTTAINISSLANPSTPLGIGGSTAAAVNTNDHEVGPVYYGNGIPLLKNRKRLANYIAPKSVKFT